MFHWASVILSRQRSGQLLFLPMKRWINWGKPSFTLCYRPEIDAFKPRQVHSLLPPLQILSISFSLTLSVPLPFFFSCMFYLLPLSHLSIYLQSITIKTGLLSPDADPPLLRVSVMDSMIKSGSGSLMQLQAESVRSTEAPPTRPAPSWVIFKVISSDVAL